MHNMKGQVLRIVTGITSDFMFLDEGILPSGQYIIGITDSKGWISTGKILVN